MMEDQRKNQITAYTKFADFLSNYETKMCDVYRGDNTQKLLETLGQGEQEKIKTELEKLGNKIQNPFIRFRFWIKEEHLDLNSLMEAIGCKGALDSRKSKLDSKKKNANSDLDKLQAGKKTVKTLFKGNTAKANEITKLTNQIALADQDRENYELMIKIVTIHLYENVIPKFKAMKVNSYVKALQKFAQNESDNSNELVKCWSVVLESILKTYQA